jgi:site-specific DNA recombinase
MDAMLFDGYVRVSTEEQHAFGISLDAQRSRIAAYAELYGRENDFEVRRIVEDGGISAKTLDRPGLRSILGDLDSGAIDGIIVVKLDRLTRSLRDWNRLIDTYFSDKVGRKLISVSEQINTTTATGRMLVNLLMTIAQWEREIIAERTTDALQEKIRRGERCGKVRYGFRVGPDGKTLRPIAHEQIAVMAMRSLRWEGKSLRKIAALLHAAGFRPPEGAERWAPGSISKILRRAS